MPSRNERMFSTQANPQAHEVERRRPDSARVAHSILFKRLCFILLAAPWLIILAVKAVFATNGLSPATFFLLLCLELAIITLVSLTLVNARVRDLRVYEARREHERLLFSYARDGMLLIRVRDIPGARSAGLSFVIQAENPAAVERLRSIGQAESYVDRDIEEAFPKWLRPKLKAEYTACVTSQQPQRYEICHPDGRLAHETVATPVIDPVRQIVTHIIVIMRDIGDRMKHERDMAIALQRAEAANKSKSEFLASMSHELRTPLNAILGFSEALSSGIGGGLSEKQKEYVGHVHHSGHLLLGIISDILDLSKIDAGQVILQEEPVEIKQLIDSCLMIVRGRAAGKKLKLTAEISPDLPKIKADPLRLKQILINLLSNAMKFTDEGAVRLTAEYQSETGFEFTVTDTGIGMTAEGIEIALQPFGQVESAFARNRGGRGLGLPIARHLAALHSGTITLSSSPGLGTRVTLILPPNRALLAGTVEEDRSGSATYSAPSAPVRRVTCLKTTSVR